MRHAVVRIAVALAIALGIGETALADSCPYCGAVYGNEFPSWDRPRVMGLRAAHEAVCPERADSSRVYADDVDLYQQAAQAQWNEAARCLREVAEAAESLTGQARALFDSLSPEERASLQAALDAALDRARQAVSRNQELEGRLRALGTEVSDLRQRLAASQDRSWQLLRKLEETERSVADVRQEQIRADAEAAESRAGVASLERAANRQSERLAASRASYWRAVGDFFRGRDLGTPRDYTPEVLPRTARTQRGTRSSIPEVRSPAAAPAPTPVLVPAAPPVAALWSRAFVPPVSAAPPPPPSTPATAEGLRDQILTWEGEVRRGEELGRKTEVLLIETRTANDRLRESLSLAAQRERQARILEDERRGLAVKLQWAAWELDVNTRAARERIGKVLDEWRREQAWDLSRKIWQETLRSESLGNSAYAHLRLAYDLVEGDLPKVPRAIRDCDRPEVRGLVDRLEHLDQKHGKDFLQNLFEIEDQPLPGQKWVEKLLGRESEDEE